MNSPFDILLAPTEKNKLHEQQIKLNLRSGPYVIGEPVRPYIKHDNGFLDKHKPEKPTPEDLKSLAEWKKIAIGATIICNNEWLRNSDQLEEIAKSCHGQDLTEATAAYRNFLWGRGKPMTIDYEKYLREDSAATTMLIRLRRDFQKHIEVIGKDRTKFSVTSDAYAMGPGGFSNGAQTLNWVRAIGAHFVWVSADVSVKVNTEKKIEYHALVTLHMEDRYNFNPNQKDQKGNIEDKINGRFEITGLAHQFMTYGTAKRTYQWTHGEPAPDIW